MLGSAPRHGPVEGDAESGVTWMDLLAPLSGWVVADGALMWTSDGGRSWADITPIGIRMEQIRGALFLDERHGWLLEWRDASMDGTVIRVWRTADGAATWTSNAIHASPGASGRASLDFFDPEHGEATIQVESSSNFHLGERMTTRDGGASWRSVALGPMDTSGPSSGERPSGLPEGTVYLDMASASTGWGLVIESGCRSFKSDCFEAGRLFRTEDGGRTWVEVRPG